MNFADKVGLSISTTLTGLVIVFVALIALTVLFGLFGLLMQKLSKNKRKRSDGKVMAMAPVATNIPASVSLPAEDENEIIAVIAAAVAALGESTGKQYRIRQVRRASRSEWAMAGLLESTRPF